jgi:long-subunit fatty acid transport protein
VFEERFKTRGYGINIKLGMIYKPQEFWRIGLAFHSPTFYQMTDSYDYIVTTNTERYKETLDMATSELIGTNSEFKYNLITPYRIIGSISYVLREIQDVTKQRGFITADVEYVNHAASSFSTSDDGDNSIGTENYLKSVNRSIDNAYKGTFNFRAGGELKFTTFMVRLGAAYYGNPYKEIKDEFGDRLNLSGGLGYRNKGFFVDLTYVHARNRDVHYAYRLQNGAYAGARLNNINGHVVATLGLKF